ncbi:MAG: class I SAM-dependent methyltransferase family protein [Candidatus Heimdallarchaeota archaeon]
MSEKEIRRRVEIPFIKLRKIDSQVFIQIIKDNFKLDAIIDNKYKILHENNFTLFPLVENKVMISKLIKAINNLIPFEILTREGLKNQNYKYKTLDEALTGKFPNDLEFLVPKSYDIIGDIAILEFKDVNEIEKHEFEEYKRIISQAVIQVNKNVLSVFEKISEVKGEFRLRKFSFLFGEDKSETIHRENKCLFKLDIKKTYFSPRLSNERRRVANSNIRQNEVIVDMFSGVGPFSIQIARLNKVEIHAFDVNPQAYENLRKNIDLNKLKGKVFPYNLNIKEILVPENKIGEALKNQVDRVIMNLPEKSFDFIKVACFLLKKSGGTLHIYSIVEKPKSIEKAIKLLDKILGKHNWLINKILNSRIVKSYSPKAELVAIDLDIKYLSKR